MDNGRRSPIQKSSAAAPSRRTVRAAILQKPPEHDDRLLFRIERCDQARRIARDWITRIETKATPESVSAFLHAMQSPLKKREWPELQAEELYSELGRCYLINLIDMRRASRFYDAHEKGERTEQVVLEAAELMLFQAVPHISNTNEYLDLGLNVEPLRRLLRAISDVASGSNNRLLVTGELADRLNNKRLSRRARHAIEAHAAAVVELLIQHEHAKSQIAAASLVATSLKRAGYSSPGRGGQSLSSDTIKRWHNRAKAILQLVERTTDEAWFSSAHDWDRSFHDIYFIHVYRYEPHVVEERRRSASPEDAEFDPDKELGDLAKRCLEARTFD